MGIMVKLYTETWKVKLEVWYSYILKKMEVW